MFEAISRSASFFYEKALLEEQIRWAKAKAALTSA